ncbi:uncharacterized protein LOC132918128 isoform X1 [Rhopalosiphum padi]|uniref:uncharacterized protein LOC132918128 isoform X1 n=1 Tax=Rhopalosiphum padi TaxID=40932 RepID=UPI00298E12CC|nr:uncharacterized protein LOC132918128 isoform X1 [Rhopalosiphum padi]
MVNYNLLVICFMIYYISVMHVKFAVEAKSDFQYQYKNCTGVMVECGLIILDDELYPKDQENWENIAVVLDPNNFGEPVQSFIKNAKMIEMDKQPWGGPLSFCRKYANCEITLYSERT